MGRVVDSLGHPLQGVQFVCELTKVPLVAESDEEGVFSAKMVFLESIDTVVSLLVNKQGYICVKIDLPVKQQNEFRLGTIELHRAVHLSGIVVDALGEPVPGAIVFCTAIGWGHGDDLSVQTKKRGPSPRARFGMTTSDISGRFVIEDSPSGKVRVWAKAPITYYSRSEVIDTNTCSARSEIIVVVDDIPRDKLITGVVVDESGGCVPNARISAECDYLSDQIVGAAFLADEHGKFVYVYDVVAPWNIEATCPGDKGLVGRAEAVAPGTRDLTIVLRREEQSDIAVLARGEDGTLIESFLVRVYARTANGFMKEFCEKKVDPAAGEGCGCRVAVPPGKFELYVDAVGYKGTLLGPYDTGLVRGSKIEVTMKPRDVIKGEVVFEGQAVSGANVSLYTSEGDGYMVNGLPCIWRKVEGREVKADGEGMFVMEIKGRGPFIVRAESEGFAPSESGPFLAGEIEGGEETITVEMKRGGTVSGKVIPSADISLFDVVVIAARGDDKPRACRPDNAGSFRLDGMTPGRWFVTYSLNGEDLVNRIVRERGENESGDVPWNCIVEDGAESICDVNLCAEPGCMLDVVLLANGMPKNISDATLQRGGKNVGVNRKGAGEGVFELWTREKGRYDLTVTCVEEGVGRIEIRSEISLEYGRNDWQYDMPAGSLRVKGLGGKEGRRRQGMVKYDSDGANEVRVIIDDINRDEVAIGCVPVGSAVLLEGVEDIWIDWRYERRLAEFTVWKGEETTVRIGE